MRFFEIAYQLSYYTTTMQKFWTEMNISHLGAYQIFNKERKHCNGTLSKRNNITKKVITYYTQQLILQLTSPLIHHNNLLKLLSDEQIVNA